MRHYNNAKVKKTISYFPVKLQDCQETASGKAINVIRNNNLTGNFEVKSFRQSQTNE